MIPRVSTEVPGPKSRAVTERERAVLAPGIQQISTLAGIAVAVRRPDPRRRFRILRTDRGFRVHGQAGSEEELERALREAGAKSGDEVQLEGEVLELQ